MKTIFLIISICTFSISKAQERSITGLEIPSEAVFNQLLFPALPIASFGPGIDNFTIDGFPPVQSQYSIGSCASWSTGYYLASFFLSKKTADFNYKVDGEIIKNKVFNPLYIHNQIKYCSNSCLKCGSSNYAALDFLEKVGTVSFADFDAASDSKDACNIVPNPQLKHRASANRIQNYAPLVSPYIKYEKGEKYNLIKNALLQNMPVIIGMPVDNSFKNAYGISNYNWTSFSSNPSTAENHSMICVGFSDKLNAIRIINSWSRSWGDTGYAWISKSVLDKYLKEAYIVNVKPEFLIDFKKISNYTATVQSGNAAISEDSLKLNVTETSFFINNRYQEFDNIRMIPLRVTKNSGTVKFYKRDGEDFSIINISTLRVNQPFLFEVDDKKYVFEIYNVKPWIFLGKKALYFMITRKK